MFCHDEDKLYGGRKRDLNFNSHFHMTVPWTLIRNPVLSCNFSTHGLQQFFSSVQQYSTPISELTGGRQRANPPPKYNQWCANKHEESSNTAEINCVTELHSCFTRGKSWNVSFRKKKLQAVIPKDIWNNSKEDKLPNEYKHNFTCPN